MNVFEKPISNTVPRTDCQPQKNAIQLQPTDNFENLISTVSSTRVLFCHPLHTLKLNDGIPPDNDGAQALAPIAFAAAVCSLRRPGFLQNNVQKRIVPPKRAHDLPVAVKRQFQPLVLSLLSS